MVAMQGTNMMKILPRITIFFYLCVDACGRTYFAQYSFALGQREMVFLFTPLYIHTDDS